MFRFSIDYDDEKLFHLKAKNGKERDEWVEAIQFLMEVKDKLGNAIEERSISVLSYISGNSSVTGSSEDSTSKKGRSWKTENVGKDDLMGIIDED